jgi:hypothetical protein
MGKSRVGLATAILSVVSWVGASVAQAQHIAPAGGSGSGVAQGQAASGRAVSTRPWAGIRNLPVARRGVHFNPAAKTFVAADGSFVSLEDLLHRAPGLSSNYYGLSVFNQDPRSNAAIDPVTERRLAVAERRHRNPPRFAGTIFYLSGGGSYAGPDGSAPADSTAADQVAQQPQDVGNQETPPVEQAAEEPTPDRTEEPEDVGQFILVLQNGTQLEAVAFTRMKDRIVYITADGSRRTIAAADLNSDATVQINEERGTPLQL